MGNDIRAQEAASPQLSEALTLCREQAEFHEKEAREWREYGFSRMYTPEQLASYADAHAGTARTYRWIAEQLRSAATPATAPTEEPR